MIKKSIVWGAALGLVIGLDLEVISPWTGKVHPFYERSKGHTDNISVGM
jgi:hypothetical protein